MLTDQEIACLETTVSILKPIFNFTDGSLGENILLFHLFSLCFRISNSLLESNEQDNTLATQMKNTIASDLIARHSSEKYFRGHKQI